MEVSQKQAQQIQSMQVQKMAIEANPNNLVLPLTPPTVSSPNRVLLSSGIVGEGGIGGGRVGGRGIAGGTSLPIREYIAWICFSTSCISYLIKVASLAILLQV